MLPTKSISNISIREEEQRDGLVEINVLSKPLNSETTQPSEKRKDEEVVVSLRSISILETTHMKRAENRAGCQVIGGFLASPVIGPLLMLTI